LLVGKLPSQKVFIDANIVANWIAITKRIEEFPEEKRGLALSNLKDKNCRASEAFEFLEAIINNKFADFSFVFTPLCFTEIVSALFKKYIYDVMHENDIPPEDYPSFKHSKKITDEDLLIIADSAKNQLEKIKGKINVIACGDLTTAQKINSYSFLFLVKLRAKSHDAFLLGEAVGMQGHYFITNDNHLIGKAKLVGINEIKLVKPRHFFLDFKAK